MRVDFPWCCDGCGKQNMVDLAALERRVVDKLVMMDGFICVKCGGWSAVFYSTESLRIAMQKLEAMDEKRKDYQFHFGKVMKKAQGIQERATGH